MQQDMNSFKTTNPYKILMTKEFPSELVVWIHDLAGNRRIHYDNCYCYPLITHPGTHQRHGHQGSYPSRGITDPGLWKLCYRKPDTGKRSRPHCLISYEEGSLWSRGDARGSYRCPRFPVDLLTEGAIRPYLKNRILDEAVAGHSLCSTSARSHRPTKTGLSRSSSGTAQVLPAASTPPAAAGVVWRVLLHPIWE